MAYADPQAITINAISNTLPRTSSGVNSGAFTSNDGNVKLSVSHTYGKRVRRMLRLDHAKIAPDAFSSQNLRHTMSSYLVIDTPVNGYTPAEAKQIVDGLVAYLAANSGSSITKLLGGEN